MVRVVKSRCTVRDHLVCEWLGLFPYVFMWATVPERWEFNTAHDSLQYTNYKLS
jgi:hypothetical protein